MYLAKLEIQGFKSFAQSVQFEFPRGLTSVVGPNGSGKSNVADAVRWVLGEQSAKLLRGKKSEDVIFAGSAKKARLGLAEVSMWLDNRDHRAPIDASEVVLTRRVYRSGEGEYFINRKPARLQDILLLLAQANFGQKTYAVIGQGMVETFLTSTPEQRKELFEDAAGVRSFQMKKEQSLHKLAQTKENLQRVELLLQEIEPRLRSLTRQVKRLERRSDVERELREHQVAYYAGQLRALSEQRGTVAVQHEELARTKAHADRRLASVQKELEGLERDRPRTEAFADLQRTYTDALDAKNKLVEEQAVIKGRLELVAAREGRLEVVRTVRQRSDASDRVARLTEERQRLTGERERLRARLAEAERRTTQSAQQLRAVLTAATIDGDRALACLDQLETAWSERARLAGEDAGLAVRLAATEEIREQVAADVERAEREARGAAASDASAAARELAKQDAELAAKVQTLDRRLSDIRGQLTGFNAVEQEKKERLFVLQKAFRDEQQTLNVLTSRLNELDVQLAKLDTHREDVEREVREELPAATQAAVTEAVRAKSFDASLRSEDRLTEIQRLKKSLELIGGIEDGTAEEYEQTRQRHDFLRGQSDDLSQAIESLERVITELDETIKKQFDTSFERISKEFERYFRTLFGGGAAKLILQRTAIESALEADDNEDDEEGEEKPERRTGPAPKIVTGIDIQANPPGKKVKSIAMLSGGERAMTAIALISAIIASNPSPFVVLDEVDAALDEANSARFAKILAHLAEKTQFIAITHNRTTMEHAQVLYGVTMGDDGISKLLSIKMAEAEKVIASYGNRG